VPSHLWQRRAALVCAFVVLVLVALCGICLRLRPSALLAVRVPAAYCALLRSLCVLLSRRASKLLLNFPCLSVSCITTEMYRFPNPVSERFLRTVCTSNAIRSMSLWVSNRLFYYLLQSFMGHRFTIYVLKKILMNHYKKILYSSPSSYCYISLPSLYCIFTT
jgi:hypothetical protein